MAESKKLKKIVCPVCGEEVRPSKDQIVPDWVYTEDPKAIIIECLVIVHGFFLAK